MDKGGTQTNGAKDREINDYVYRFMAEGWQRQILCVKERK